MGVGGGNCSPAPTGEECALAVSNADGAGGAAGGVPGNVGKVTVLLTDVDDREHIYPSGISYFGDHGPASTLVEVSALVSPAMKVEIECEAIVTT